MRCFVVVSFAVLLLLSMAALFAYLWYAVWRPRARDSPPPSVTKDAVRGGGTQHREETVTGTSAERKLYEPYRFSSLSNAADEVLRLGSLVLGPGEEVPDPEVPDPEVVRLERLLEEFTDSLTTTSVTSVSPPPEWGHLIAIGDIYRRGAFPRYRPNPFLALECYRVAAMCPHGATAGTAQWKYIEAREDPIPMEDQGGGSLPERFGRTACRVAMTAIRATPQAQFERVAIPVRDGVGHHDRYTNMMRRGSHHHQPPSTNDFSVAATERQRHWARPLFNIAIVEAPPPATQDYYPELFPDYLAARYLSPENRAEYPPAEYLMDSQNVHDHSVMATARHNLERLRLEQQQSRQAGPERTDREGLLAAVTHATLESSLSEADKLKALEALESIGKSSAHVHSSLGITEPEALRLVWNKITAVPNATLRGDLTQTLASQLASAVEHGHVVCSTGKITRLLGALDGVPEVAPEQETMRPTWAVREELATMAARVRDRFVEGLSHDARKAYDQGQHPSAEADLRAAFEKEAMAVYRDELGMNEKILKPIVDALAEGF